MSELANETQPKQPSKWGRRLRSGAALVAFALVGVALVMALGPILEPKNNSADAGMINASSNAFTGEKPNTIDAVFIGDSETYTSLSPMEMWQSHGLATYNCSTSGQTLPYCSTFLDRILERQHPKVVFLEANALFRRFSYEKVLSRAVNDAFPAIEYHDRWKQLTPEDFVMNPENTWTDDLKGFKMRFKAKAPNYEKIAADEAAKPLKTDIPARNLTILESMNERCKEHGAQLVIVVTPSIVNWNDGRAKTLAEVSAETGIPYIDMNEGANKVDIDWQTESYDGGDHVNFAGAKKVSAAMADLLAATYNLPDHRGDETYNSFANALPHYQELVEKKVATKLD